MATSDELGYLKIWDLRTYKQLHSFKTTTRIRNLTYSQKGLLAMSVGRSTLIMNLSESFKPCSKKGQNEIWNDIDKHLYLRHTTPRKEISSLSFCPYEDVLGIGNSGGFSSIIVPGSGEPNYDIFESNPFETKKERNNKIVYKLLDKLQPDMIQLNPDFIGMTPKMIQIENKNERLKYKNKDQKWARKNITKTKKNGYRGVLRKRYSKYHHMKDLHLRQEKMIKQLNIRTNLKYKQQKQVHKERKEKYDKYLTGEGRDNNNNKNIKPALSRFIYGPQQQQKQKKTTHQLFKSKWKRKPKKVYF